MEHDAHAPLPEVGLGPDPEAVRELLAIRPGGLCDVVRAVPALRHLRDTYPNARITVATAPVARDLLDPCPYVDRWISLQRPSEALLEQFDVAVSFAAPDEPSSLAVDAVRAGVRASWLGVSEPGRGAIQPSWPPRLPDATRMLRLAWLLGGSMEADASMGLWPSLADRNGAALLVRDATRPLALVHVGARRAARRWPAERWARVIDVIDAIGFEPVLVGASSDANASSKVLDLVTHVPISVVGRASVGQLVGLLERATLFIGSDCAPAALAGALDVRSVIVGPGSLVEHDPRPGLVDLVDAGACARCGEHACGHAPRPAADVPLERVLARVELAATTALERWRRAQIA
jgi:ADP-heptose:LPS heptosyltransferase